MSKHNYVKTFGSFIRPTNVTPVVYANDPAIDPSDQENLDLQRVQREDAEAKAKGSLIGRILYDPRRESFAGHLYQIADEHKKAVMVVLISGLLPYPQNGWGETCWVPKTKLKYLLD